MTMRKNFTLLFTALAFTTLSIKAQEIYDDFDNPEAIIYSYYDGTDFNQGFSNPSTSGANPSALCAKYVRNNATSYDVIVIDPAGTNAIDDITDFNNGIKSMSMKVFSPSAGLTVQITLEDPNTAGATNYPTGRHSEYTAVTTVAGDWETLTFSKVNNPDATVSNTSVNRMVILFEPGMSTSTVWLWDDLMGPEFINPCAGVTPDPTIGDDYECQRNVSFLFANGTHMQSEANPLTSGINSSTTCGKFTKYIPPTNDGAFGGDLTYPFNTGTYNSASIQLYSPAPAQAFQVILQDGAGSTLIDYPITTSSTTDWEEHTIDLSTISASETISKVVFLLNPSTSTEDSIYLDNFQFSFVPVSVKENDFDASISIYPLPVEDNINIVSTDVIDQVTVFDIAGKQLFKISNINDTRAIVRAAELTKGNYLVQIKSKSGKVCSRNLVK